MDWRQVLRLNWKTFRSKQLDSPDSGCILWTGKRAGDGYGRFTVRMGRKKCKMAAHRYAFAQKTGHRVAESTCICHTCDNRRCVNPNHLYAGTDLDNFTDMVNRRRHPGIKVTPDEVELIFLTRMLGGSVRDLASEFKVKESVIKNICTGKRWQWIIAGLFGEKRGWINPRTTNFPAWLAAKGWY